MPTFAPRLLAVVWLLLAGWAALARAAEPAVEFLHAAQDRGYGEVAIAYLEQLRASGRLPQDLAETYDLELSRSYRAAVAEAFNATEAATRMTKAQEHLDKFLQEHANHPQVARAMESWGDLTLDRGLERLRQAAATKDPAQREKLRAAAREDFAAARPRFVDATERYLQTYTRLKKAAGVAGDRRPRAAANASRRQRDQQAALEEAEFAWLECRFKSAKLDFFTGQSYADLQAPQRKQSLEAAAQAFDDVFQSYRESLVGLHAHLWHGRAVDELGQDQLALDIYDEVLAISPDGRERESGVEPLFAQAQYHRLLVIKRQAGPAAFLAEAEPWLELRRVWRKFDGYQGVMLEVARANLARAGELSGSQKSTVTQAALAMLADIGKVRGEYQQEAILLRRQHTPGASAAVDPATAKTFDEALALGDEATQNADWPAAAALFERALQLKTSATDNQRVAEAETRLDRARYQLAAAQYSSGKFDESLATAERLVQQRPAGALAPQAAALSVSAALALYARAEDKPTALARLDGLAAQLLKRWPDKAEADDARIALGQASLVRGELDQAAAAFEEVNPRSLRYGAAMFLAGQTNWRRYLIAKSRPGAAVQNSALAAQRATAEQQLRTSLDHLQQPAQSTPAAADQVTDAQLLLAEVQLEAGQAAEAAALIEPLAAAVRQAKPKPLDNNQLRILLASARADAASAKFEQVAATATLVAELGDDTPAVNGVLNTLFKVLVDAWKQSEAAVIEARTAADATQSAAAATVATARKKLAAEAVPRLAARKQNTLAALIFVGDTAAELGQADVARDLYQAILTRGESDAPFKQSNGPALTRIQAQLVGLLRQKGQYNDALIEVNKLIDKFPNALEPLMEKGRVLQSWADEQPARMGDAVRHWTLLRTRLARLPRKPPEYYEVVYQAANCLFIDALKSNDPQKALQADQLLSATLVLSPKLSGPELVARYKELLAKTRQLQGRPATATSATSGS
ncbi:MAG: hypothetical protein AB7O59_06655 [Pirellulales bacterium]